MKILLFLLLASAQISARAELLVAVSATNSLGRKVVLKLDLRNTYTESVESARGHVFLTDEQGKVVGHGAKWILGGIKEKSGLKPDHTTNYNFVVNSDKPFTTVIFSLDRVILEGGKVITSSRAAPGPPTKK
jgi:hypothetical protein